MPLHQSLPSGELASGLYYATLDEIPTLMATGEHLDIAEFRNACLDIAAPLPNASRAFGKTVMYLGRQLDNFLQWELYDAISWLGGNPNKGIRRQLLIGTQCLVDMVDNHENNRFDVPPRIFTPKNWRVMRAVVREEFEVSFTREHRQTKSHFLPKDRLETDDEDLGDIELVD